ncbi:MAG: GHKL domain-containing protein [Acetatifactor sp.]|nr:GHKL domain-containing protein [Acetatifactor sp.]
MHLLNAIYGSNKGVDGKWIWLVSVAGVAAFVLLLAGARLLIVRYYEKSTANYQNKLLKNQIDEVHNVYMTMRGWRHDYHNHMQSLKAYLVMDNIEEAREYLDKLETDLDDINLLFDTGNIGVDAILNSKISLAIHNRIPVDYKVTVPKETMVTDIDLCVVLGNLIDNAVESCMKVVEADRFIRLYIGIFKEQLYISVSNATNETVRKLDEEYITNKRGNHGHGLKRINKIVEKYEGYINRKNEAGVFVTEIMLPL